MLSLMHLRMRGAALLEFHVVALFALLPLALGTLQICLLLVENHHLDHAAFLATRHGAVSQGSLAEIRRAYIQAATPLFVTSDSPVSPGNVVARVTAAQLAAAADVAAFARVRLLTPDPDMVADFSIRRGDAQVIPNDALEFRSMSRGTRSGRSLQQANVLRVEFTYCRPLVVPFAGPLLLGTLRLIDHDLWHQRCYAAGRVPVRSEGVAPMQSDFRVTS